MNLPCSGLVTSTLDGCTTQDQVSVTVNPIPVATANYYSQEICSGTATSILLTSNIPGTSFSWTVAQNNCTGGTPSSGTSITQILYTTSTQQGTAVYTITPTGPTGCLGNPIQVCIRVKPIPAASATPSSQTICSGGNTAITLNGAGSTNFTWTVVQTDVTGAVGGSSNSGISQTLIATGTTSGTAVYTITPSSNFCQGSSFTVNVTVNPKPVATASPVSQTFCSGGTTAIVLTSNVAGTTYTWTVAQTGVSGATGGSGSTIAQTLTATGTTIGIAVYTITPTAAGCTGTAIIVTITVKPNPIITATPASQAFCISGTTSINLTSNVSGTTYSWTVVQTNVSGASPGSGTTIAQILTATGTIPGTAVYTITSTANACSGNPVTVTITVTPVICTGGLTTIDYSIPCMGTTTTQVFGSANTITGKNISIGAGSTLNVTTTNITFNNCNFIMGSGASIVLQSANLTISNNTHFFSCGDMWNGITIPNSTKQLKINQGAFIEDAINAVVSINGGNYVIQDAIFNKNLTAVQVKKVGGSMPQNPGTIIHSIVTSRDIPPFPLPTVANLTGSTPLTGFTPVKLKAPYNKIKGLYGVDATDIFAIQIGIAQPASTNTFDAIMCGINLTRTNATIYNNNFQFLLGYNSVQCCPAPPMEDGFGIKASGTVNGSYSVTIGGSTAYKANSFTNTYRAIFITKYMVNNISGNSITNTSTGPFCQPCAPLPIAFVNYGNAGIYVNPTRNNNTIDVVLNTITNCNTGIWVNRNQNVNNKWVFIDQNTVKANPSGYCTNGISITDLLNAGINTPVDKIKIQYNTIQQAYTCISATNVKSGLAIRGNPTLEVRNNGVTAGNGIRLQNCSLAKVHQNTNIYLFPAPPPVTSTNIIYKGINVTTSTFNKITCNNITNMGESMTFMGSCISSTLSNNKMTGGNHGLVLRNNGEIGAQGNTTVTCGLWWNSAFAAQTYTENTTTANNASRLYVNDVSRPSASYTGKPTLNLTVGGTVYSSTSSPAGINIISTSYHPKDCSVFDIPSGHAPGSYNGIDSAQLTALAYDNNQYPVFEQENRYQHKLYAFDELDASSGSGVSNLLQNFYDSAQIATLGQLKSIDTALANNSFSFAGIANNAIVSGNLMEANQKAFNELCLPSLSDTAYNYTQAEKDAIYAIAIQCPLEGGNAVWQARVLFCTIENDLIEFDDNCTDGSNRNLTINNKTESSNFVLYPNPNDGTMELAYTLNTNETGIFELYDITGKLMANFVLDGSRYKLNIDNIQLNSGIYFYNIRVNERVVKTEKIVIIK